MYNHLLKLLIVAVFATSSARAVDLPQYLNFDGGLTDDSGNPITTSVNLTFRILDPSGNCLLYEETRTAVVPDAIGNFSVKIGPNGGGTRNSAADGGLLWKTIFQNDATVRTYNSTYCPNASGYIPAAGDARKLRVIVNATTLSPDYLLAPVPYATVAESLQGKSAADFIPVSGNASINGYLKLDNQMEMRFSDGSINYVALRAPPAISSTTTWSLPNLDGTNGQVLQTDGAGHLGWMTPAGGGVMTLNGLAGGAQTFNTGTAGASPSWNSSGAIHTLNIPMANTGGTSAGLLSYADWNTFNSKQNALGFTPMNQAGGTMSGVLSMASNIDMGSNRVMNLLNPTSAQDAATKTYVDNIGAMCVQKAGDSMTGALITSMGGNPSAPAIAIQGNGMFNPGGSGLGFATNTIERMRIDTTGNVGIGTTSPAATLDVYGSVKISPSGTPIQMVKNMSGVTCSFAPATISSNSTGNCTFAVGSVNPSDNAAVNCQPTTSPAYPMVHSCYISAASQITLVIHNAGGGGLTPPTNWNITVIKF